ncbi:MAG: insulinase family protein, partial [Oscillatoriales cyanobacterium SM2_2_1]|nr:insulinase family protein [Oscillatoriales cyanobacterium SM2_2_1]
MWLFFGRLVAVALAVVMFGQLSTAHAASLTDGVVQTVLDNGLTVLTKEVKTAPVVTVQVWYRVGSRNERPGITGISHMVEHLMFKGTQTRPVQFGRLFSALGSSSNAFTSYDMTAYYGTVGSNKLNGLLELEADRMANARVGAEELGSERSVVLSELDGGNNNPGTRLYRQVMRAAFPQSSYGWMVIGDRRDVENYTVADVQSYYRTFYRPDNATLVVVGDFETQALLRNVRRLFGGMTRPSTPLPAVEPLTTPLIAQPITQPITLREPGSVPFLLAVYPTLPKVTDPNIPALDLLENILSGGRSSRLYQALVEKGLATSVSASASGMMGLGWFSFNGTPSQGRSLEELDRLILAEVERLKSGGVTADELARAQRNVRTSFIMSNRDMVSQANQIAYLQTVTGDYRFGDRYLAAIAKVTPADIQRVARQYLDPQRRVVGFFMPTVITAQAGQNITGDTRTSEVRPSEPVNPAEVAKYLPANVLSLNPPTVQPVRPERFVLPNGLTTLLLVDRSSPTVAIAGSIEAGSGFDTAEKAGLAALTAQNLRNGTRRQTALELAKTLEDRGASLGFGAGREAVGVSALALKEDFPVVLNQLAEVLQTATFPDAEFQRNRDRNLVSLKSELDSPGSLARRIFQQELYPAGHPFHVMRTEASLKAIQQADLATFYRQHYRPDTTTMVIMGDFDPNTMKTMLRREFGPWQAQGMAPRLTYPEVPLPDRLTRKQATLPGKTQAVTLMGHPSITRRDPRYHACPDSEPKS